MVNERGIIREMARRAAEAIACSKSILISAGAGMGVDSGLPDFRGPEGFWRAYPPMKELGLNFSDMSTPRWFREDPALAWGFFGHRLGLYKAAMPHGGFEILRWWAGDKPHYVFTSNVDGQFQKAGFDSESICECHGTIHMLQCTDAKCSQELWPSDAVNIEMDEKTMRAESGIPHCPTCSAVARPNILMFYDGEWRSQRTDTQVSRIEAWLSTSPTPMVVIEMGAGNGVPTVRRFSENIARQLKLPLIRINPREANGPAGTISLECSALDGLRAIDAELAALNA